MQFMRGLGAMSDREGKTLTESATALDRSMTEDSFNAELAKIEKTLLDAKARTGGQGVHNSAAPTGTGRASGAGVAGSGSFSVTDPDGGVHQFATQAQADAAKKRWGIK